MSSPLSAPTSAPTIMAFVSPAPAAGRTNALTNIAWILAAAGKRVLVIDWCGNRPRVQDFLPPFEASAEPAHVLDADLSELAPADGKVRTYQATSGSHELVVVTSDQGFPEIEDGSIGLRQKLRAMPFDHVLIDAPQELSDDAITYFGRLCDAVAVCSPKRRMASLQAAADVVRRFTQSVGASMRVLAMPLFDPQAPGRDTSLAPIRATLEPLRAETASSSARRLAFDIVEVPDQPYETYQQVLAALADDPEATDTLLAAYLRAARWLSDDDLAELTPVKPDVRRRYLRSVQLGPLDGDERVVVVYPPSCRPWADWAVSQLRNAGARVWLRGLPPEEVGQQPIATVVVTSAETIGWTRPAPEEATTETYWLLIDGDPPESVSANQLIDLRGADPGRARARLLSTFGLFPFVRGEERSPIHYPGQPKGRFLQKPARNPSFTGRSTSLEKIQDRLVETGRVTLTGGPGIGKSELAREFVHRFGHNYDLVCWLPAQDTGALRAGLTELGVALKVPETAGGTAEAALNQLAKQDRLRWLLVYDNAESIDVLREFLPPIGRGHVLITSRDYGEHGLPEPLEIPALLRAESVALLRSRVPGLDVDSAESIAGKLTDLPLALQVVSSLILQYMRLQRSRGDAPDAALRHSVDLIQRLLDGVAPGRWPGRGGSLGRALSISIDALRQFGTQQASLIVGIAEIVAFLSPEGVSLRLLRSREMLAQLAEAVGQPEDLILFDAFDVDQALVEGKRFGLFEISWGPVATLRMHRAVQGFIRERMSESTEALRRGQAIRGLAQYAPSDPLYADDELRYRFEELQPHLEHTAAWKSTDPLARLWVCMQIRHLFRTGDSEVWRSALAVARRAEREWLSKPLPAAPAGELAGTGDGAGPAGDGAPADAAPDQPPVPNQQQSLLWRLRKQMADLHRGLGRPDQARDIDAGVVDEQMAGLGGQHRATLTTKRGLGGDLRALGDFRRARASDTETLFGFQATLGEDHPETRMAAHNLAISAFLAGDAADALRREEAELAVRLRLFGENDLRTLRAAGWIGSFQRELGHYDESRKTLIDAFQRMVNHHPHHLDELAIRQMLSATYRRLGQLTSARIESTSAHAGYQKTFGENHPYTRAAKLNLAIDLYLADELEDAVHLAEFCRRGLEARLSDGHPFIALCWTDLSLFYRRRREFDVALRYSEEALQALRDQLGETHRWTMAASTNHAGNLSLRDRLDEAVDLQRQTVNRSIRVNSRHHPYTTMAQRNLALIEAARDAATPPDDRSLADIQLEIPQT